MTRSSRIHRLNDCEPRKDGRYVLYWMHRALRASGNPALQHAVSLAREYDASVLAVTVFPDELPDRYARHYAFMLQGLKGTSVELAENGIKLCAKSGSPPAVLAKLADEAIAVVCDGGYLRQERRWRDSLVDELQCPFFFVETEAIVPVGEASHSREYAARTIRKKINDQRDDYIARSNDRWPEKSSLPLHVTGDFDLQQPDAALKQLPVDPSPGAVKRFTGGTTAARKAVTTFIRKHLKGYAEARQDPSQPRVSLLSPYLNYGQISPVEIAAKIQSASRASDADKEAFLEELIVRRELAFNYVQFERRYDRFSAMPDWARETLDDHASDDRPEHYTRQQLEDGKTDDPYWNAAMNEMRATGYMHNYMRMYWGKKIIEWTNTPTYAFRTALYLNNKYFLDGRNENSFANVGWLFGLHDRAWTERDVFGKVRYMNANGLRSKFDIDKYVDWAEALTPESRC